MFRNDIAAWIAAGVAVAALVVTWICWINMGKSWRMGINPGEKTELVFTGPFAFVRHPIYGLSQLLVIATFIALPSPLMLVIAILHILFMQWEVRREGKISRATSRRRLPQLPGQRRPIYPRSLARYRSTSQ